MNFKLIFILPILFAIALISTNGVYAEQVPGSVLAVETNPYYFSEGGLGIEF